MLIYNKCRVKEKRARYAANPLDYKKVIADGWVPPPNDLTGASAGSVLETRPAVGDNFLIIKWVSTVAGSLLLYSAFIIINIF